jgi:hypothetical protein
VNIMRRQNRKFELSKYEALLMEQGDEDVISSLEALMLAVADEMRRRTAAQRGAAKGEEGAGQ